MWIITNENFKNILSLKCFKKLTAVLKWGLSRTLWKQRSPKFPMKGSEWKAIFINYSSYYCHQACLPLHRQWNENGEWFSESFFRTITSWVQGLSHHFMNAQGARGPCRDSWPLTAVPATEINAHFHPQVAFIPQHISFLQCVIHTSCSFFPPLYSAPSIKSSCVTTN